MAGMEKTKKTVLLSKRTTHTSGRWEKVPPFPLVSEQKRFTLVYLNELTQLQETETKPVTGEITSPHSGVSLLLHFCFLVLELIISGLIPIMSFRHFHILLHKATHDPL